METEAPCSTWRRTSGAAPDAVKAARPVLNGGREETCRQVTRLAPTQRRGGGDQTGHLYINRTTSRPLKKGRMFPKSALRALSAAYKNFLFEDPSFCPSLQGKTMGREGLRRMPNRVDLGARTWYRPALWPPQGSGSTKTPSSRSSAITGGPSSSAIRATRIATCRR